MVHKGQLNGDHKWHISHSTKSTKYIDSTIDITHELKIYILLHQRLTYITFSPTRRLTIKQNITLDIVTLDFRKIKTWLFFSFIKLEIIAILDGHIQEELSTPQGIQTQKLLLMVKEKRKQIRNVAVAYNTNDSCN